MRQKHLAWPLSLLSFALLSLAAGELHAAGEAVRELGQPSFRAFMPNRLDARGLSQTWGVAVDTSRTPNGLWVLDAGNNRVLGWRDVTALRNGAPADVVLGQPNARSNDCNYGGISAASLCLVESSAYHFAYEPGLAVDGEGNLYVADQFNRRVLGYRRPFETDFVADVVLGQAGFDQGGYNGSGGNNLDPYGLAADAQGNLYVSDYGRVVGFDRPLATDAVPDRVFGNTSVDPAASGQGILPKGLAVDGQGRLYVADAFRDRVLVWKQPLVRQGAADVSFSQGGRICEDTYSCRNLKGIAVTPGGDVWVGSYEEGKIFGYRSPVDGDTQPDKIIKAVLAGGEYDPDLRVTAQPVFASGGLAVDSRGALWLADVNRILGFLDPWHDEGRAGLLLGQIRADQIEANLVDKDGFESPGSIAVDTRSSPPHLYVLDAGNSRVLGWADAAGFANGQPADLVIGQPDRWASSCNTGGRSLASLCLYRYGLYNGIAVDARGTLWVADPGNQRVLGYLSPFTTDTVADRELGGAADSCRRGGLRGICQPGGVAVDKAGNVYVADILKNRILEFNEPMRRDAMVDRVIGAGDNDAATFFSEENHTHPGTNVYGGSLAADAEGRLLVGIGANVYVFDRPLAPGAGARKLIDSSAFGEGFYFTINSLATDPASRIYLTAGPHVYRFPRGGGSPTLQLGEACAIGNSTGTPEGLGRSSLCNATGVAVGPDGDLFVSDAGANRVLVFDNP